MQLAKICFTIAAITSLLLLAGCELDSSDELSYQIDGLETQPAQAPAAPPAASPPGTAAPPATVSPPPATTKTTTASPSNVPSGIGTAGRGGGFLWKPVSESDGKLVVLLPNSYKGIVTMCYITDSAGGFIESGRFVGDIHNGERPHFRFSKPGAAYGASRYIVSVNNDGTQHHWFIPNGASRIGY